MSRRPITLWTVVVLHLLWAGLLASNPAGLFTTPVYTVYHHLAFNNREGTIALLLLAAISAVVSILIHRIPTLIRLVLLVPQQAVLVASAAGGVLAAVAGSYADGVLRPFQFIATDQLVYLILATAYTISIYTYFQAGALWTGSRSLS